MVATPRPRSRFGSGALAAAVACVLVVIVSVASCHAASVTSDEGGNGCPAFAPASCEGVCVDLQTNPSNCGECGKNCPSNECAHGVCTVCTDDGGCVCPTGWTVCRGTCVDTLSDPRFCGGCDAPCDGQCFTGLCASTIATLKPAPWGLAVDEANVYVSTVGDGGAIVRVPIGGGSVTTLASSQSTEGVEVLLAVDSEHVYWTTGGNTVLSVSKDGGASVTLASGQQGATGIAVDGAHVYWTTSIAGTIVGVGVDGGAPVTLAMNQQAPVAIAAGPDSLYWANLGEAGVDGGDGGPPADAGDAGASAGGSIVTVSKDGGTVTTIVSGWVPTTVAVDPRHVYFMDFFPPVLVAVSLTGTDLTVLGELPLPSLLNPTFSFFEYMAVDPDSVYVSATGSGGGVYRVVVDGGSLNAIAPGGQCEGIAVDTKNVYWVAVGTTSGVVMQMKKP